MSTVLHRFMYLNNWLQLMALLKQAMGKCSLVDGSVSWGVGFGSLCPYPTYT